MNHFSDLPENVQILYLLDFSYEDIINYCGSGKYGRRICNSADFWYRKAFHDFGLPLSIIELIYSKDVDNEKRSKFQRQYRQLQYLYEDNTALILDTLMNNNMLNKIPTKNLYHLLNHCHWLDADSGAQVVVNESFYSLLYIAAKDIKIAKVVVKYLTNIQMIICSYLLALLYYTSYFYGSEEVQLYTKKYQHPRLEHTLLFEAMAMGDLDIVKFLLVDAESYISEENIVRSALIYGKSNIIAFIQELYPQYFDRGFINDIAEELASDDDIDALKKIVSLFGSMINYNYLLSIQLRSRIRKFVQYSKEK